MNVPTRLKLRTAERVRDFLLAHSLGNGPVAEIVSRFVEMVGRALVLLTQHGQGMAASKASSQHRRELRRELTREPLRHLRKIARAAAAGHPEITLGARKLDGGSETGFLATVRAMMEEAGTHKDTLLKFGLSEASLAELATKVVVYEQAMTDANAGLRAHTGARAELDALTRELMRLIQQLDGIVSYQFRDQPEVLGAWRSARNVAWPLNEPAKPEDGAGKQSAT